MSVFEREKEREGRRAACLADAAGSIGVGVGVQFPLFGFASGPGLSSVWCWLPHTNPVRARRLLQQSRQTGPCLCVPTRNSAVPAFVFFALNRLDHGESEPVKKERTTTSRSTLSRGVRVCVTQCEPLASKRHVGHPAVHRCGVGAAASGGGKFVALLQTGEVFPRLIQPAGVRSEKRKAAAVVAWSRGNGVNGVFYLGAVY